MAGTGHDYEVINVERVRAALRPFRTSVSYPEGRAWFGTQALLRFVTSPNFVIRVSGQEAEEAIANNVEDGRERAILRGKLAEGRDLRLFVPEFLDRTGPDFRHIADWIESLPKGNPRMVGKLRRIDLRAAVLHAGRWVSRMARESAASGKGTVEAVCETGPGRLWVELKDGAALLAEAVMMNHCVNGYEPALARGTRIFSLRDGNGRAAVTVELVPEPYGMAARQIRGNGNHVPDQRYFPGIAAFLNHMDVQGEVGREAAGMGILRRDGAWRMINEVGKRIDIGGLSGFSAGNQVHLMSPVYSERVLAVLDGSLQMLEEGGDRSRILLSCAGDQRAHSVSEQRAIARLASEFGIERVFGFDYLQKVEGGWLAWVDTCEHWSIGAATFLMRQGVAYVMNDSLRDILVVVGPSKELPGLVAQVAVERRDWSVGEVRRIAAVLDMLSVETMNDKHHSLSRTGLRMGARGRWFRFQDVAVSHAYGEATTDGRELRWMVAPYLIVLRGERGEILEARRDESGGVAWVSARWVGETRHLRDFCRLANELGIHASPEFAPRHMFGGPEWAGEEPGNRHAVVCLGRTWQVVTSPKELLAALRKSGRKRYRDDIINETAIRLLPPPGTNAAADIELARHLAAWAAQARKSDFAFGSYLWRSGKPHESAEGRLRMAAPLLGLMSPSERKRVTKGAELLMRSAIGRSKRPSGAFNGQDKVREFLLLFRDELGPKFMARAIPWALYIGSIAKGESKNLKVDIRWREILERHGEDWRIREAIRSGARWGCHNLKARPEEILIETPQDVKDWIWCIETSKERYFREAVPEALGQLDELVASRFQGEEWDTVRGLIAETKGRHVELPKAA